ncbi:hypothetical protein MKW98_028058 [Papaver atlanticum]|uniref:MADS-box domain-containing protein n=1 Tax=Papaver atlanticum TaxID=357466 RepID=A0AAD4SVJ0_9MAGN|nr:hypothetical protein MKW98_028058 [Papaver atlanticum]
MARKKIKLAYIADANARRATFKKRRSGLLKKVSQLSTLCDVNACAVVYGPYDRQPEIWPQQPEARSVIARFKRSREEQFTYADKQLNPESYTRSRVGKINEQFFKHRRENHYMELNWMYNHALTGQYFVPDGTLADFSSLLGDKEKQVKNKLAKLKKAPTPVVQTTAANTGGSAVFTATNAREVSTIDIPNFNPNFINAGGSGISGGTVTGGDMYGGVANHHNQDYGVIINGTGGQEMLASDAANGALQSQPFFMDVTNPPSVVQSGDQLIVDYLEGYPNNDQMLMQGGIPTPYTNDGLLEDIVSSNSRMMMPANNSYVPMNSIDTTMNNIQMINFINGQLPQFYTANYF